MKKQILTKQDIQCELISKLNEKKCVVIWLTAFLCISVFFYFVFATNYSNGIYLRPGKLTFVSPTAVIIIVPFIVLTFAFFLFKYYYSRLYKIKTGKFEIIEDTLCQKKIDLMSYYRHTEKENLLYFYRGRIAVEKEVYSYSAIGDRFYVVIGAKKTPELVYHTKYYEIKNVS